MRSQPRSSAGTELAERVQSILESRNLSLYSVSQKSATIFGHASPYFLPHNFYYELRVGTFSPSLQQIFALSKLSNYRMTDWLHVFGLYLEEIPRLQILLPTKRTALLDSSVSDPEAWLPWFQNKSNSPIPPIAPLSQLLTAGPAIRQRSLFERSNEGFLYAKIGREDALAFPDLLPGSIVRINPRLAEGLRGENRSISNQIFLVEHSAGICCCRLHRAFRNQILLVSAHLPYAQVQLELHREAKILGVVDLEIRRLFRAQKPNVSRELAKRWRPEQLTGGTLSLSQFLQAARARAALSLREASLLSKRVASMLNDERYFLSASALSDYEARDTVPRHFHKVVSLCLLYAVSFHAFLDVVGISDREAGTDSVPDHLVPRSQQAHIQADTTGLDEHSGFLGEVLQRLEEWPVFLKGALADISGLTSPSLRSFFWVGGLKSPLHPYLENALLVSVDRHRKRPLDSRSRPLWEQSLYVVLSRDGSYLCGPCGLENGVLVIHPEPQRLNVRQEFRNQRDAEVIGQVCAVLRKL